MSKIENLKDEELVSYYKNRKSWTVQAVREFEDRVFKLYNENYDFFKEIETEVFNGENYGQYSIETRNCDSWGGLDDIITKIFDVKDIDELAKAEWCNFLFEYNDDLVIFNSEQLRKYILNHKRLLKQIEPYDLQVIGL